MKKVLQTLICFIFIASVNPVMAVNDSLGLKKEGGKTFIMHRVDQGETLFQISQRYDVSVEDLKGTNPQTADELVVGEVILVPYDGEKNDGQQSWNYHKVEKGETLFSISQEYDASVEDIKSWNKLEGNNIEVGQKLKVGKKTKSKEPGDSQKKEQKSGPRENNEPEKVNNSSENSDTSQYAKAYNKKTGKKKQAKRENGLIRKKQEGKATFLDNNKINTSKSLALHRSAPPGTIIKVTNPMNEKQIFVRTVGKLNKDRSGNTLITISKNAADKLGVDDDYFRAKLTYTVKKSSN